MTSARIVIAPDSFKGSASALDAAEALRRGWLAERPGDEVVLLPMADGGEGSVDAFAAAVMSAGVSAAISERGARMRVHATGVGAPRSESTVTIASPMPSEVSASSMS